MFMGVEGERMIATGDSESDQFAGIMSRFALLPEHAKNTLNAGHPSKTRVGASPKNIKK
jgi:hypothetical protein